MKYLDQLDNMKGKKMNKSETYPVAGYRHDIRAIKTGEFRPPKKGEYYLNGIYPVAYRALTDLSGSYHIVKRVYVVKLVSYEILGPV